MEKLWKIKNVAKPEQNIKISVAVSSNIAPGIILKPGQFCIGKAQMTAPLDKQVKCSFVTIERDFENKLSLDLAKAYDESALDKATDKAKEYTK